jgi:cobalt/nickel transport system ATP-binding protein
MTLDFRDVEYRYPDDGLALAGISLDLAAKRIALLGSNGAGKTTLLLHMNGSLRPRSGSVHLDGVPAGYDSGALRIWRQRVALVLQDPDDQLFAATVAEDVSFGPMNLRLDRAEVDARVASALADMNITDLADRATHALSFGQRKRVAIAGALAMQPRILVLDEPTAGLDPAATQHLLAALQRLSDRGVQIVFSTHDADLAYAFADHLVLLQRGRVVAQGPSEVLGEDAGAFSAAGLEAPYLPRLLRELAPLYPELAGQPIRSRDDLLAAIRGIGPSGAQSYLRRSS